MTVTAYVAIGSNLDAPQRQLRLAFRALSALPRCSLTAKSSVYCSKPMGPADQPDYLNAVARLDTALGAYALLEQLQRIERVQGRGRASAAKSEDVRWGPRTLDLDLLLYGGQTIRSPNLTVPHPGLHERDFVLQPLYEVEPGLVIPGHGPVSALIAADPTYRLIESRLGLSA